MKDEKTAKEKVLEELDDWSKKQDMQKDSNFDRFKVVIDKAIELTEKLTKKDLICSACGFPKNMERAPVIMDSNPLSFAEFFSNTCEECRHQKDGSTVKVVYEFWQKLANELIRRKEESVNEAYRKILKIIDDRRKELQDVYDNMMDKNTEFSIVHINCVHELEDLIEKISKLFDTEKEGKTAVTLGHDASVSKDQRNPERLGSTPKSEISKELFDISVRLREMSYGLE